MARLKGEGFVLLNEEPKIEADKYIGLFCTSEAGE